jgi:hypothetical protein
LPRLGFSNLGRDEQFIPKHPKASAFTLDVGRSFGPLCGIVRSEHDKGLDERLASSLRNGTARYSNLPPSAMTSPQINERPGLGRSFGPRPAHDTESLGVV